MQKPHIRLDEIIWEITGKCGNKCKYCGSKDVWKASPSDRDIVEIARAIAKFPPKEIDISGGDPTLVPKLVHQNVHKILKDDGVEKVKVLVHPKSIKRDPQKFKDLYELYDWVGISLNDKEDLKILKENFLKIVDEGSSEKIRVTFITNFNLLNIFLFNEFKEFIQKGLASIPWMVQYTIYKEKNDLALYEHPDAIKDLISKIQQAQQEGTKMVISDNMSSNPCSAGGRSIGITFNGDVIPCLSMRSWEQDLTGQIQGNVLDEPLKDIWMNGFKKQRFCKFKCCKDICKNKSIGYYTSCSPPSKKVDGARPWKLKPWDLTPPPQPPIDSPIVSMYAVFFDDQSTLRKDYGGTFVYAVPTVETTAGTKWKTYVDSSDGLSPKYNHKPLDDLIKDTNKKVKLAKKRQTKLKEILAKEDDGDDEIDSLLKGVDEMVKMERENE